MSENKIYEISRLMQSPENFRQDIADAIQIVSNHFKGKYISPIEQEIKICSEECRKAPTKEMALLEACRPFVKDSTQLDNMLGIINGISVVQRLIPSTVGIAQINDSSIHDDGIYDIDKSCSANIYSTESLIDKNTLIIALLILILG